MYCPKCGSNNSEDAAFCTLCSARLNSEPRYHTAETLAKHPGENTATWSLIWGLVAILVFGPLGIVAIILGNNAKKMGFTGGQATAGIILGWVALILMVISIIMIVILLAVGAPILQEIINSV